MANESEKIIVEVLGRPMSNPPTQPKIFLAFGTEKVELSARAAADHVVDMLEALRMVRAFTGAPPLPLETLLAGLLRAERVATTVNKPKKKGRGMRLKRKEFPPVERASVIPERERDLRKLIEPPAKENPVPRSYVEPTNVTPSAPAPNDAAAPVIASATVLADEPVRSNVRNPLEDLFVKKEDMAEGKASADANADVYQLQNAMLHEGESRDAEI